jgi:hypothetical protein
MTFGPMTRGSLVCLMQYMFGCVHCSCMTIKKIAFKKHCTFMRIWNYCHCLVGCICGWLEWCNLWCLVAWGSMWLPFTSCGEVIDLVILLLSLHATKMIIHIKRKSKNSTITPNLMMVMKLLSLLLPIWSPSLHTPTFTLWLVFPFVEGWISGWQSHSW